MGRGWEWESRASHTVVPWTWERKLLFLWVSGGTETKRNKGLSSRPSTGGRSGAVLAVSWERANSIISRLPASGLLSWAQVHRDRSLHLGNACGVPPGSPTIEGSEDGGDRRTASGCERGYPRLRQLLMHLREKRHRSRTRLWAAPRSEKPIIQLRGFGTGRSVDLQPDTDSCPGKHVLGPVRRWRQHPRGAAPPLHPPMLQSTSYPRMAHRMKCWAPRGMDQRNHPGTGWDIRCVRSKRSVGTYPAERLLLLPSDLPECQPVVLCSSQRNQRGWQQRVPILSERKGEIAAKSCSYAHNRRMSHPRTQLRWKPRHWRQRSCPSTADRKRPQPEGHGWNDILKKTRSSVICSFRICSLSWSAQGNRCWEGLRWLHRDSNQEQNKDEWLCGNQHSSHPLGSEAKIEWVDAPVALLYPYARGVV